MKFDFKNATKEELQAKYKDIASKFGNDQFFTKKELDYLPEILREGEQVLAFTSGLMDGNSWLITLTDKRIIFLDKGIFFGFRQTTIDLDKINSISGKTGLIFGDILIEDGAKERMITNVWKKTVTNFTNLVQDAINENKLLYKNNHLKKEIKDDPYVRLEKLAGLLDKGIISQVEFDIAKDKVLGI